MALESFRTRHCGLQGPEHDKEHFFYIFTGPTCGSDINECVNSPCLNGATCRNLMPGYACDCLPGYTSDNCGVDIDECISGGPLVLCYEGGKIKTCSIR